MKRVLLWVLGVGVLLGFSQAYAACDITAVTSPNGGEQWSGTQSITWTQTGCTTEFVTIDFSSDSGGTYPTNLTSGTVLGTAGSYSWDTTGQSDTTTARIRVDGGGVTDESDADFEVDNTDPVLAEVTPVSTPDNDATPDVTFSSTEAGTITYGGGCDSVTTAASSGNNTVTLDSDGAGSDLSDGTYAACTITVTDAAGNASTALTLTSFTIDTDNPDVTIDEGASQDDPTNTSPIVFDVVFDEAINDTTFTDADIDTTGSTATPGAITVTEVAPMDDTTFEVSIVVTGDGDLTATVMTGSIADLAGNLNNAAISTDNTVTYDTMAPSDPGSSPDLIAASDSGASSSDNITSDTTPTFDIECTETGATITLYVDAGSDATHVCAGVGTEQITANTLASGSTYAITYSETDVATNESGQSPSLNVTIDTGAPSSTITTSVNPIYEGALTQTVTVTYDEAMDPAIDPVIGFSSSVNFTSAGAGVWSGGNTIYTESFTHDGTEEEIAMETADITVATATDVAGNLENVPSSSSPSFEIDTDVPTILSAVTDDTMGAAGQIDEVQVTFSEALDIASLALSDFDAGAYTVSGLNATMGNPTVTLTLDELGSSDTDATPTISIIGDGVNDEAGNNLGTGDAGDNIVSTDGADPAITGITSTAGDGPHNEPDVIDVNVQFSESVTIAGGSLQLTLDTTATPTQGTISGISLVTVNYTVGAGENSSDLNVTLASLTAGTLQDSAGNDADLTLPSGNNLADNHAIVVDTDAPGVTSIMADTNPVYSGDLTTEVVVVFDETMNTGVTPTVAADTSANFSAGSGLWSTTSNTNDTYTVTLTHNSNEEEIAAETISVSGGEDPAGNTASGDTTAAFVLDTQLPNLLSFTSSTGDDTYGPGTAINVTATYDETVTGTVTVTLNNTGTASLTCSGTTCTGDYTVGATGSGEDITGLTVSTIDTENVTDANGNNETGSTLPATNIATGSSINVDTTAPTLPTVTVASSYTPSDEAIQSSTVTLSLTADEAIVSTPTVVVSASDSDPIGSCSAPTDVSAGARTSWDAECVISTTDAEGIMSFTIDFEDDYGNDGVQVTSTTDASTVTIKHYGSGGGSGALSTRGQDSTDEEEDEEELIDNDESEQEEEEESDDEEEESDENSGENEEDEDEEEESDDIIFERDDKDNFMSFHEHLADAGIVKPADDCEDAKCERNAKRKEVAGMALHLGGHKVIDEDEYTRHFSDIDYDAGGWVPAAVETGLGIGYISGANDTFRPEGDISRSESYGMLMKSVCMSIPTVDIDWQTNVFYQAAAHELTVRSLQTFDPNADITRQELFVVGSLLLDYVQENGGCY